MAVVVVVDAGEALRGLGGASASLGAPATYAISGAPRRPLLADLDGDGRPDLAGTTTSPNGIGYRLNRGDGTFGGERRISWAADAWDLGAADVTGDGRQDLIAIAFSVDPSFGHTVDALMVVDLLAMPEAALKRYLGAERARALAEKLSGEGERRAG